MLRAMDRRQIGIGLALTAALISGVSVWVNAMAVRAFGDPVLYTTVKNVIAAALLILLAVVLTSRASRQGLTPPRGVRQLLGLGFVGVVGGGVAFVLFFQGLALTTASSAGFIQKTLVIWVAILAVSFLHERFGRAHVAAIALLVVGQMLASGGAAMPALSTGEALVFIATLLWALEVVIAKRPSRSGCSLACHRSPLRSRGWASAALRWSRSPPRPVTLLSWVRLPPVSGPGSG